MITYVAHMLCGENVEDCVHVLQIVMSLCLETTPYCENWGVCVCGVLIGQLNCFLCRMHVRERDAP